MATNEPSSKIQKIDNQFIGAIKYKNDLPDPSIGCKFLPCGKTLMDYTLDPVSYPQLETNYSQNVKGLQMVLDIDLLTPKSYQATEGDPAGMDPKDAELLADIEPLHINNPKPKVIPPVPTRVQDGRELFARERLSVPRPRTALQLMQAEPPQLELEALTLEEQKQLINQTFVDIYKPINIHPTKSNSTAHPTAVLPVLPNPSEHDFVQIQFGIPPTDNTSSLLKDCGNYLINFRVNAEPIPQPIEKPDNLQNFVSDQRYKEERASESADRGETVMLMEKEETYFYEMISRHMKLRKERPNAQSSSSVALLQVTFDKNKEE